MKSLQRVVLCAPALVFIGCAVWSDASYAQVADKGLPTAASAYRSLVDAAIVRDSGINQPLDLLNDFYPAIEVTISQHDNVRRRSDVEEDDLKVVLMPSLGYRTNLGRHQFYIAYSGLFTYFDELNQEESSSNNLVAQLGLDLTQRWDMRLVAGLGETFEERGTSGSRPFNQFTVGGDTGPDELEYGFYGVDIVYGQNVSPLNALLGYERHTTSYQNNGQGDDNPSVSRDRNSESIRLDVSYKIAERSAVFFRVQHQDIDYDRSINSLDNEQTDLLFGIRWKPTNALSGVLGLGRSERDYDDVSRNGYDGESYYANLNYMINPFSILDLSASKTVEEPGDAISDYYVSELIGLNWNHAFNPKLVFNAFAKWVDDDYDTDREDQFFDFGVGLDFVLRPWLKAGVYYGEIERDSTLQDLDYDDRYYGIRFRSDLRPLLRKRGSVLEPASFDYPRSNSIGVK